MLSLSTDAGAGADAGVAAPGPGPPPVLVLFAGNPSVYTNAQARACDQFFLCQCPPPKAMVTIRMIGANLKTDHRWKKKLKSSLHV